MLYIVSYDIVEDKRRNRLSRCLMDFGDRVQYSVFECLLEEALLKKMISRIKRIVNQEEDKVRIYVLCATCQRSIEVIGKGSISKIEKVYII